MEILSHRGLWKSKDERNKRIAFERSFDLGMGTETDLRDHNGEIVIAHDMPTGSFLSFSDLLCILNGRNLRLALNIKADGLSARIREILTRFQHTNYFVFDMSIPDLVQQLKHGMVVFTGLSDIQPHPVLLEKCHGIWLDCFHSDWYKPEMIDHFLSQGKRVCIVSADLHQRDVEMQWKMLRSVKNRLSPDLMLCTDKPLEAREFFGAS